MEHKAARRWATTRRTAAVGSALLVLTACVSTDDGDGTTDAAGDENLGLAGCVDDPNTCNTGERADGGDMTWIVTSLPGAWNTFSPEGGSVYATQMLHGIYPHVGNYLPDRVTYEWNMDLLAEEPELISEDPQTWQYVLRDEAVWDDGTPITADDFIITWKLGTAPEKGLCEGCRPRATTSYDQIAGIEGSDDGKTVTVTLEDGQFNAEWFTLFNVDDVGSGIMPAHVAEQNGFDIEDPAGVGAYFEWLQATMPTFSGGPYRIVEGDLENQVIKEPNENWYGEVQPTLDTLIVRFINDQSAWVPALSNGEVHGASPIQLVEDLYRAIDEVPDVETVVHTGPSWEHVDFNLDVPAFADPALRHAIFTAIDAANIAERHFAEVFPDYRVRTNHIFSQENPYHEDVVAGSGHGTGDEAAALEILEDAGYEFDGTTLTLDGEQIGPFRLRAAADAVRATSMELIQADLAEIGVGVEIEPTDDLGGTLSTQDYDIALFGWSGSPAFVTSPATFWHSESGSNFGKYNNPEVDAIIEQIDLTVSQEEAAELANQAAALVVEDAYSMPLYDTPVFFFVNDDFVNVRDNTAGSLRGLYNNHEWGVGAGAQ